MVNVPQGTCPDCGRQSLRLSPERRIPRHKTVGSPEQWPNPRAAYTSGWCKGSGRHLGDTDPSSALRVQ